MRLIDKLGIDIDLKPKVTFGSYSGAGKTTILTILAGECYLNKKKVLFLSETKIKHIVKKVNTYVGGMFVSGKLTITSIGLLDTDLEPYFKKGYDLIIVDYPIKDYTNLVSLATKYDTAIITSTQLKRFVPKDGLVETNREVLHASDMLITITRKIKQNTFLNKIVDFLRFWKKRPNTTLKVVKNRYGKEFSTDVYVDFENVKIK